MKEETAPSPSSTKFSKHDGVGAQFADERWSVHMRFTSSGLLLNLVRAPASAWQIGMPSFAAARAPARVEFVSP